MVFRGRHPEGSAARRRGQEAILRVRDSSSVGVYGQSFYKKGVEDLMFQPVGLLWGIITLIFGLLVLIYPRFLRYTVGIYLLIVGLWAIIPRLRF